MWRLRRRAIERVARGGRGWRRWLARALRSAAWAGSPRPVGTAVRWPVVLAQHRRRRRSVHRPSSWTLSTCLSLRVFRRRTSPPQLGGNGPYREPRVRSRGPMPRPSPQAAQCSQCGTIAAPIRRGRAVNAGGLDSCLPDAHRASPAEPKG